MASQKYRNELDKVRNHPIRLYTIAEIASILRISPHSWRVMYQDKIPPIKAYPCKKGSRAYWTDEDVVRAINLRFPKMDAERRRGIARRALGMARSEED